MLMGSAMMAKKKAARPAAADRKTIAVTIKGSPAWKDWIDGLADHCRLDVAKVIDLAVVRFAEAEGYNQKAPQR
jgi:TolB-like protein